jgi:hypothetical protein
MTLRRRRPPSEEKRNESWLTYLKYQNRRPDYLKGLVECGAVGWSE